MRPTYLTINRTEKCVMARIRRHHVLHQANFTLRQYGGWRKAKAAAQSWVGEMLARLPDPISRVDRKTSRNTSGVVGVRLADATRRKGEAVYPDWRWVAFWSGCPQSSGIGWSVNKYGDRNAFAHACIARRLQSIDRDAIAVEFERLRGTPGHRALLRRKRASPP